MGEKTNKQGTLPSHVLPKKDHRTTVLRRWEVNQAFTGNLNCPQTFDPQPSKYSNYRYDPPIPPKDCHLFSFLVFRDRLLLYDSGCLGILYIDQTVLELTVTLLSQHPTCWDYRCEQATHQALLKNDF